MAVAPAQRKLSFRRATRQHYDTVGTIAFAASQTGRLTMPQVGFCNGILIRANLTVTNAPAGALTADSPWNIIRRVRFGLNTGIEIDNLTGYELFVVNHLLKEEFNPQATGSVRVFTAPTLAAANAWVFTLFLPVAANDGLNFEAGLVNLQTEELRATLEIDWGAITDPATNVTAITGNAEISYLYYEIPDPRFAEWPPLNVAHRLISDRDDITGVGDRRKPILRQGISMQLAHIVRLNGARNTADVEELRLELNRADRVYRYPAPELLFFQAMRYGQDLPAGVFVWDWWHAQQDVAQGDGRDFIDTEAVAQTDSVVRLAAGAVLGANNNFLDTIRRHTVVLRP